MANGAPKRPAIAGMRALLNDPASPILQLADRDSPIIPPPEDLCFEDSLEG